MVRLVLLPRIGPPGRVFVTLSGIVVAAMAAMAAVPGPVGGAPASHVISYLGEQVSVPAAWTVQDLAAHPSVCVRFDVHVVYEGRIGPQPDCPARVVGVTEAIHLEPLAGRTAPPGLRQTSIGGQQAEVNSAGSQRVSHRIVVAFMQGGVLATISFGSDASLAQQVLASFTLVPAGAPRSSQASSPAATMIAAGPVTHVGKGFDACTAPSETAMNAWLASPYRAVGVYIGGLNRACDQPNLTATWVQDEIAAGWSLIPLYVGLQASCALDANLGERINHAQAAAQGTAAGGDAADQASALGMRSGSPIYFDMEAWDSNNSGCNADVVTFIHAWTNELNARGFRSGMYGSAGAGIAQVIAPRYGTAGWPGYIDFAEWDGNANTTSAYLPTSAWPNRQRIKQYNGNVTETWRGVQINIDRDYANGLVVGNQTPGIAKVSPPNAAVGTTVTITGQGFVAGNTTVRFGGSPSGHVAVASGTQLTASVPAHGITTVDITVSTAGGTTAVTSADQFTYRPLNAMAVDPATSGYWLTTPNGNVYEFNAPWYGSKAGTTLPAPIIGIAAAPSGGYWLVTSKGNVYNYNAPWYGSTAGTTLTAPVTTIVSSNAGYLLATQSGDVFNYNAPYYGSPADRG
jgi:glycoside hydrolase-like protein/IPT/TIG domain-containing protein